MKAVPMEVEKDTEELDKEQVFQPALPPYRPPVYQDFAKIESSYFHTCVECGDRYFLESSLAFHLSRESVVISYFCKQCKKGVEFHNRCNFLAHLREHPESNRSSLSITIKPLLASSSKSTEDGNNGIELIGEQVNSSINSAPLRLNKGILAKILDTSVPLPKNNVKLLSTNAKSGEVKVLISEPQKLDTVNRNVTCRECGVKVTNIRNHFLEDNKPLNPKIRCPSCDQLLPTKCSLKAHIRIHLKKPPFVCPDCMKEFAFFELFMVHLRYFCFHLDKSPRFGCQACPGVFPSLTSLEVHLASRHVKPVFKCVACPRAFFEQKLLNEHKLHSHEGIKVQTKFFEQCQLCPQKLLTKNCLFLHIHEHVMNKSVCFYSYKCSHCQLVTDNKLDFASHRLTCPSSQIDTSALALAKLAKASLSGDALSEKQSITRPKSPAATSASGGPSLLVSNSPLGALNGKSFGSTSLTETTSNTIDKNNFLSPPNARKQVIWVSPDPGNSNLFIPQRVYKACGWHPNKCVMCIKELSIGTLKTWQTISGNYKACEKWNESNRNTFNNSFVSHSISHTSPVINTLRKSHKRNSLALNGPSLKLPKSSPASETYLCHICKHSLPINHGIIRKHFRQQHPDVEIVSLFPLLPKLELKKTNVPLEQLRFSIKTSKVLRPVINKSKPNGLQLAARRNLLKAKQNYIQNHRISNTLKDWLTCPTCSFRSKNKKTFRKHMNAHKSPGFKCQECKLEFVSEPSLRIHLVMHHGQKEGEKLPIEESSSNNDPSAVKDPDDGKGTKPLKCKVCHKTFVHYSDLQKHFRIHGMAFLMLNKDETVWRKV